jgi:hypothetical protein
MTRHEIWRYIQGGTVKHALAYASAKTAMCGASPPWWRNDWYGTGNQTEYEILAARRACRLCMRKGYQP